MYTCSVLYEISRAIAKKKKNSDQKRVTEDFVN